MGSDEQDKTHPHNPVCPAACVILTGPALAQPPGAPADGPPRRAPTSSSRPTVHGKISIVFFARVVAGPVCQMSSKNFQTQADGNPVAK